MKQTCRIQCNRTTEVFVCCKNCKEASTCGYPCKKDPETCKISIKEAD
jgi:hypothetical protein